MARSEGPRPGRGSWIGLLVVLFFSLTGTPVRAAEPVRLELTGVEGPARDNVLAMLAWPPGLIRNGQVDQRWLQRFAGQVPDLVRTALEPFGYYQARIQSSLEEPRPGNWLLKVAVEPSQPVRVSEVRVEVTGPGAARGALRRLVEAFPLKEGDILLHQPYEDSKRELLGRAMSLGYLDAAFSRHEIRIDAERRGAAINLVLETGPRYYFGEVSFEGAEDYPRPFLRRYLTFEPGDAYSQHSIGQSQINLLNSDRFRDVRFQPDREQEREGRIPLTVQLEQSPSRRLRPGIGYGTDTGARMSLTYKDLNVWDRGHEWSAELNLAEKTQLVGVAYLWPDPYSLQSLTAFRAGLEHKDVANVESSKVSAEVERVREFGRGRKGSVFLNFFQENFTIGEQEDSFRMILPGVRFSQRGYRDMVRPRGGYHYALEARGGFPWLGSDTGVLQLLASGNTLVALPARWSLFARLDTAFSLQEEGLKALPASLRFFAGGDRSVRGYGYQTLGPRDSAGDVVGGRHLLVGSLELERAFGVNWGVAGFFDAGNAFNSFSNFDLAMGAGLGLRYYTPVGPIRLDVARQIDADDPSFRLHFSIGFGW